MIGCLEIFRAATLLAGSKLHVKSALLALVCFHGCGVASAQAQLRSGRTQRTLYSDAKPTTASVPERVNTPVRTASAQRLPPVVRSGANQPSTAVTSASHVHTAACKDCGDGGGATLINSDMRMDAHATVVDDGYAVDNYAGCGPLGCDEPGCVSCGCFSDLVPTCSSMACSPGRGPLMSLWCRMSVRAEVPLYWRRAMETPALVSTSPVGTDADLAGELGRTTTQILLGNGKLGDTLNAGVRLTLATPLGNEGEFGLMFRYWNAGDQDDEFNFSSNQFPILARPFRDTSVTTPVSNTQLVAFPGDSVGNVSVATSSEVDGLELTLKRLIYKDRFTRVDWLWGYQHVSIDESLRIASNTTVTGNIPGLQGNTIAISDNFATQNNFNGVSYGLMSSRQVACWKMESMFRLGMGNLRREVNINGSTTTTANGMSLTTGQGLLARNTNSQPFVDDTFVVVPEVGINFACMLRPGLDFNVGYNYLLVPKVAQASQQINDNLAVNVSDPLTGPLDPALNFDERKYWLNSLGLGLQLRY